MLKEEELAKVTNVKDNDNELEEVQSESVDKPTAVESSTSAAVDSISHTPDPVQVPTYDSTENNSILVSELLPSVSELPPVPQTIFEQERLEIIEIKNDGTSGHLSHSIE